MSRGFALASALLVTAGVFGWLAGPLLESRFGAEALIVTYAGVAIAAGAVTYVLFRQLSRTSESGPTFTSDASEVTITVEDGHIDREMEQLKDE